VWTIIAGLVVFSIGEMTQAPRYYEYISSLAPKGQQGLFQGYAFLPIAVAWAVGGALGGWLYTTYAKGGASPTNVWLFLFGIGVLATLFMGIYSRVITLHEQKQVSS
jgi:MFS family permease